MKKHSFNILVSIFALLFTFSCEEVEGPYIESNPLTGEYGTDAPIRKILIEDFTGFACPNCPRANEEIHNLQERYGKHIVPITIHSGWFAKPNPNDTLDPDFRTDVGLELGGNGETSLGFFNVSAQPIGTVNRKLYNEEFKVSYGEWSNKIVGILNANKFADIDITISNEFQETNDSLNIDINLKAIRSIDSKITLSVYIIENHIIGKQVDGSQVFEDYEHNHVLRAGINGTWGDEISTTIPFEEGAELTKSFTYTLNSEWVPENCEVVAFTYNSDTKEVIQAEIEPIISE